jgi:hypothetical protein
MFTSCGWFFDEISGIEAVQVMKYACRAMQLAREVSGTDPEPEFMGILRNAPSNIPEYGNGAKIYQDLVKSAAIDLSRVGFHYALSSLAVDSPEMVQIKNYTIRSEAYERADAGALKLATGRAFLRSDITWEENTIFFAVLHLGNHNFMGGASIHTDDRVFAQMQAEFREAFSKTDIPELVLLLNRYFGDHSYSLWHLLRDGQRKVLYYVLDATLTDLESSFRQIYRQYFPLLLAMKEMRVTPPEALEVPVQYILNVDLKKNLGNSEIDPRRISVLVDEMVKGHFNPDTETLSYIACTAITGLMHKLTINPEDVDLMGRINAIFSILSPLGLKYNLWECQNSYFLIGKEKMAIMREKAKRKEAYAMQWLGKFEELGKFLGVKSP